MENLSKDTENGFESFLNCPECGCDSAAAGPIHLTERGIGRRIQTNPDPVIDALANYFDDLFASS